MAEPIKVIIKDETGQEQIQQTVVGSGTTDGALNSAQSKANKRRANLSAAGVYVAMGTLNYVTSNVGKWTANKSIQPKIDNAKKVGGYIMTGAATHPVVAVAMAGFDATTTLVDYLFNKKWDEIRSNQAKARNGDLGGYRR